MIYLEFLHNKENMCQFSCKNNNISGIMAGATMKKAFYNLVIFGAPYWKNYTHLLNFNTIC